ncbi:MAG: proline dehydrogenase family protein [Conexivisphaerales archaeon]
MKPVSSLLLPVAKHFIAGTTISDVIEQGKILNAKGYKIIANFLGEDVISDDAIENTVQEYLNLYDLLDENRIAGSVSVKLTQLGLTLSNEKAILNLKRILDKAKSLDRYLWLDMEGSKYTDSIIEIYLSALKEYNNVGLAIQAYLKRTESDLDRILPKGGQVRLCKGAYNEPASIAIKKRPDIRENYKKLLKKLFEQGNFFAIATHDEDLISFAAELSKQSNVQNFEFQVLKGVREDMQARILGNGYTVSIYLPYGKEWLPYAIRRIRERRRNIFLLFRALLG